MNNVMILAQAIDAAPATTQVGATVAVEGTPAPAEGDPAQQAPLGGSMSSLLIWVLIFVGFYFILIRPQTKRQKAMQKMQNELKVGDSVYTQSGIIGKIVSLDETTVTLQVSEGTRIPFLRAAVSALVNTPESK